MILGVGIRSGGVTAALVFAAAAFAAGGFAGARLQRLPAESRIAEPVSRPAPPDLPARARMPLVPAMLYPADVLRVIDGDTFEARVQIWPGLEVTTKVRLLGIDAPELKAKCPEEQRQAANARDTLARLLGQGGIGLHAVRLDKYGGRVLASATTQGTPDVSAALLSTGAVRPYQGGRRESWCD